MSNRGQQVKVSDGPLFTSSRALLVIKHGCPIRGLDDCIGTREPCARLHGPDVLELDVTVENEACAQPHGPDVLEPDILVANEALN